MKDIDTIHFTSRDHKVQFRHRKIGGRTEYTMEDYKGNVLSELFNPTIGFEIWAIKEIEKILFPITHGISPMIGSRKPVSQDLYNQPMGRTTSQIRAYEDRVHRNINS